MFETKMKILSKDSELERELAKAENSLVIVDFFDEKDSHKTDTMSGTFELMGEEFKDVIFIRAEKSKLTKSTKEYKVEEGRTCVFIREKKEVMRMKEDSIELLRTNIKVLERKYAEKDINPLVKGYCNLEKFINRSCMECLNMSNSTKLDAILNQDNEIPITSSCDAQLLIYVSFNQPVRLHSISLKEINENGPKDVELFINQPRALGFDQAETMRATQDLLLNAKQVKTGSPNLLQYVKFQNVQNITIFVSSNQDNSAETNLTYLGFHGQTVNSTNMQEFKRVTGKRGESH